MYVCTSTCAWLCVRTYVCAKLKEVEKKEFHVRLCDCCCTFIIVSARVRVCKVYYHYHHHHYHHF